MTEGRRALGIVCVLIAAIVLSTASLPVYETACEDPADEALRVIVPSARKVAADSWNAGEELARLNQRLAQIRLGRAGERYRVFATTAEGRLQVVIAPRHLAICRRSYVLEEQASRLVVKQPLLRFR